MQERLDLFETYSLPSVANQTDQNFTWCIYLDASTAQHYRERLRAHCKALPNLQLFYIDGIDMLLPACQKYVRSFANSAADYAITSRFDNDDLLHSHYIKEVKQLFQPCGLAVIDLRAGYHMQLAGGWMNVCQHNEPFNAFISISEPIQDAVTVFSRKHSSWKSATQVFFNDTKRLWMATMHNSNMENATRLGSSACDARLHEFGITNRSGRVAPAQRRWWSAWRYRIQALCENGQAGSGLKSSTV
jgi:hypothetical protein